MYRTLVSKELRELRGVLLLAVAAYVLVLLEFTYFSLFATINQFGSTDLTRLLTRPQLEGIPFLHGQFRSYMMNVTICLALACGFRQTMWEEGYKTWPFLFHRPVPFGHIVLTKLCVGIGICLIPAGLTILAYACWAAFVRQTPAPFYWGMTIDTWRMWWSFPLLYLGAFLSGFRPARWIGTRLFPVIAGGTGVMFGTLFPTLFSIPMVIAAAVILIGGILAVLNERDFG
ncbi:MAG: hypothetical protein KDA68_11795 [Planctomycetaceae bacterium]|nr:hypothetical protein [Planctomycetaceae bacterium]